MIERRDGKIGHSCSPSLPSAPSFLQTAFNPPPDSHTHIHLSESAEFQASHFMCLFSRCKREKRKRKKRKSTFRRTHVSQGEGRWRRGEEGRQRSNRHLRSTLAEVGSSVTVWFNYILHQLSSAKTRGERSRSGSQKQVEARVNVYMNEKCYFFLTISLERWAI